MKNPVQSNENNYIDKRILTFCNNVENEYEMNKNSNNNCARETIEYSNNNVSENIKSSSNNISISKIGRIQNQSINTENNIISKKLNNIKQDDNFISINNKIIPQNKLNKNQNTSSIYTSNITKDITSNNDNNISQTNFIKSYNNYKINNKVKSINLSPKDFNNKVYTQKIFKYNIQSSNDTNQKIDLNKELLEARCLIKKQKFAQAYNLLKKLVLNGIKHSDLFYLFGEVNRIFKNYQTSEDFLLLALNFELHSPYVFYSLGLLYQEIEQFKFSNVFFKLFNRLLNNADLHYQMAKNYLELNELVSAAEEMTNAIELDKECIEYYKVRSEIYNKMGLKEMENEDTNMYKYLIRKFYEDNS